MRENGNPRELSTKIIRGLFRGYFPSMDTEESEPKLLKLFSSHLAWYLLRLFILASIRPCLLLSCLPFFHSSFLSSIFIFFLLLLSFHPSFCLSFCISFFNFFFLSFFFFFFFFFFREMGVGRGSPLFNF